MGIELTQNSKEILHKIFTCYDYLDYHMQNFPSRRIFHLLTNEPI